MANPFIGRKVMLRSTMGLFSGMTGTLELNTPKPNPALPRWPRYVVKFPEGGVGVNIQDVVFLEDYEEEISDQEE